MIRRFIENSIKKALFKGKAVLITGPRQVGKTTLMQDLIKTIDGKALWLDCDEPDIRLLLEDATSSKLRGIIGDHKVVLIDEAQRIKNIGITLKLLVDKLKDVQVIATGSSALELANKMSEPLTGRKIEFQLFPIATAELVQHSSALEETRLLEQRLIYGHYPEIINYPTEATTALLELSNNYLYKDLLALEGIRKPALLEKILTALALQLGNEVSFNELGQLIGADQKTVEHYIHLLEKCFVIFQLGAFSRNLRNEIKKSRKIYFVDNGIRNAIIKNFNPPGIRQDMGGLWENFLMSERRKFNAYHQRAVNAYFWRTHNRQELDYIEDSGGKLNAFEFKWNEIKKVRIPISFKANYPSATFNVINRSNYLNFVCGAD